MSKTLIRIFTVLLLTMVSMGAWADVKVVFGEKGDEKFTGTGGTITVTQEDLKGGQVIVTLNVIPDKGYTITKKAIHVYATISPNATRADEPTISTELDLDGDDPKDLSAERKYSVTVSDNFGVWVKEATFKSDGSKGPDRSGATELTSLTQLTNSSGNYIIKADVSASGYTSLNTFSGTLTAEPKADGSFPVITDLSCPLFITATDATISNIIIQNVSFSGYSGNAGAIACKADGATRIYNCGVLEGNVGGTAYTGGLVGLLDGTARVINCFSFAEITGGTVKGGIVGYNSFKSKSGSIKTMVMNCMFYGNIAIGGKVSPIYGGEIISNDNNSKLNNYNYFCYENLSSSRITDYNRALAAEERYLVRFEFYRHLLNSTREIAAWYATGSTADAHTKMAKWVLDTNIAKYPILKVQGKYPSVINYEDAPVLGTLPVTINQGIGAPTGATVSNTSLTIYDKDIDHYHFNYRTVRLPYYNEVGTMNYTSNKVVTGWKITGMEGGSRGSFNAADEWGGYNFADRSTYAKDLYEESGRVFNQGAYFDVPDGVTAITIEPYWGKAVFLSDSYYDRYGYPAGNVTDFGQRYSNNNTYTFGDLSLKVFTSLTTAVDSLSSSTSVYDNAIVLVGNFHQNGELSNGSKGFTITSIDLDSDNEPDYSLIFRSGKGNGVSPIRYDFINVPGMAMAHKTASDNNMGIPGNCKMKGWYEVTNTALIHYTQFEYDNENKKNGKYPLILQGGLFEQFVSTNGTEGSVDNTSYIHVGGNVWFKLFNNGCHLDKTKTKTPHVPISVTGGDFEKFYLSGYFQPAAPVAEDNAECYISGGRFGEVAGAGQEQINGDVTWFIEQADIDNFYGGGINDKKPITGSITVTIKNSRVGTYCGGPKFGNMKPEKTVSTTANNCQFDTFYGAGYGGTSYYRYLWNLSNSGGHNKFNSVNYNWNGTDWIANVDNGYHSNSRGKYVEGQGILVGYEYEHFEGSSTNTVARLYMLYASLSLAQTNNVTSTLTGCKITGNFYGGGNLGSVSGNINSKLSNCQISGDVFGAGYLGTPPSLSVFNPEGFSTVPNYNTSTGVFEAGVYPQSKTFTWSSKGSTAVSETLVEDDEGKWIHTDEDLTDLGKVTGSTTLIIDGSTEVFGEVYGGGESSEATGNVVVNVDNGTLSKDVYGGGKNGDVAGNITMNVNGGSLNKDVYGGGKEGNVGGMVHVNIKGGTVANDVYGGGALANTNTKQGVNDTTLVNLTGGTINGNVYGGGLGRMEVKNPETGAVAIEGIAALVKGNVTVKLNGTPTQSEGGTILYNDKCVVKGCIFGCNNLNGTPQGTVTVHIYKTWSSEGGAEGWTPQENLDLIDDNQHKYHLKAVYGGGNQAAYIPTDLVEGKTHVIIDGCELTSIRQVYGGGNAASTPATLVDVNGTYEIEEVFGGGNGKDQITVNNILKDNPGANVGFKDYSAVEETYPTKDDRQDQNFIAEYTYGTGEANVNIVGGRIHRVYGGSNTKGNVRVAAITMLEDENICDEFIVDQAYGGGKSAPMDGRSELKMSCIPGLKVAYGGAEEADIHEDVVLTITNGNYDRVFGGNNVRGTIDGNITVNVEETGCKPVIIKQLYGGGNQAPYTGNITVNVKSFTSIGEVYGGGYGKTATVTGNTEVNVDVCKGKWAANAVNSEELVGTQTFTFSQFKRDANGGFVPDEDHRETEEITETVYMPPHAENAIGAINNVYGGGNEAKVVGNTRVNIGTLSKVTFLSIADDPATQENENEKDVEGVNIIGNVYGGGNNAEVTGNTDVFIGEEKAP